MERMQQRVPAAPPRFDPLDPAVIGDPYPTYARLRAAGALCRGGAGQWVVTRYADVAALLSSPKLGHEFPDAYHELSLGRGAASHFFRRIMLYRDPPDHTRLRRLVASAFAPAMLRAREADIRAIADGLLAPLRERMRFDVVADLALPLPVMVICALLGIPSVDVAEVAPRAADLGRAFGVRVGERDRAAADRAVEWLRGYLASLLEARRREPGDDLLSRMARVDEEGGGLTRDEIVDNAVFLFFAGFETTAGLIGNGVAALLEHPGELARLRADRSLLRSAVEELLRYDAPIQGVARIVREPVQLDGRTIRAGRVLVLLLGSANRDERQFRDPDRVDIARGPNEHVSFGGGPHGCLGAFVARLETAIVIDALLRTFESIEPDGPPVRDTSTRFRALAALPICGRPYLRSS